MLVELFNFLGKSCSVGEFRMNFLEQNGEKENWVIKKCVEKWSQENDEFEYDNCCKIFSKNDISKTVDMKTIRRFLYVWGRMGRVLGRKEYEGWEDKIEKLINVEFNRLLELRKTDFLLADIRQFEKNIKELYRSFADILGPIAGVKTLHLICPKFFPLWDNAIAEAFRNERITTEKIQSHSAEDYYGFMKDVKEIMNRHGTVVSTLAAKYNENELRIVDYFAWWITHRPISLLY